jgi:hypothetical protein
LPVTPRENTSTEHQVIVGAAADERKPALESPSASRTAFFDDLLLIGLERRRQRFLEADRLGGDDVHQRAALDAREQRAGRSPSHTARGRAPCRRAGPRSVLWRRRRDEVRIGHGARMLAGGDETGDVRHVGHHQCAELRRRIARTRAKSKTRG